MHTLRFKILAVAAALIVLSQLGTVATVLLTARNDVGERAAQTMHRAASIITETTESRANQFEDTVIALAADYGFRQAIATEDKPTAESALNNNVKRAGADIALLFNNDQTLTAATANTDLAPEQAARIFAAPYSGKSSRTVILHDGVAYDAITVPVRAPLPIAWLTMGFAIDEDYVQHMESLTGQNISLLVNTESQPQNVASTLTSNLLLSLEQQLVSNVSAQTPTIVSLADSEHLALKKPFIDGQDFLWVVMSKSIAETMAPYRLLQTAAVALGAIPLVVALLGAVLLSRALTRPVQTLMEAARRIQEGDYSTPVIMRSGDELNQFASAFNLMQEEIAQREDSISYQARHDATTGLYNRAFAVELMERRLDTLPAGEKFALLIISLGAADEISGTLGHEICDAYLAQATKQLRQIVDSAHLLAHIKSDTFMVCLQSIGATDARSLGEELVGRLKAGIRLPDVNIAVNPTVGISIYPDHGKDCEHLLMRATIAIEAKDELRRPVRFYREGDEELRLRNMMLLTDLRRAVDQNELRLHYQPKISLADDTVCGAEALIRWDHPKYGWLTPDKFIPIIEQSGNISLITRWALQTAARQYSEWKVEGIDISIAVNFSAHDMQDENLPWHIMDALREGAMPPDKLIAEITEEAMVRDFDTSITVLHRLRDLGVRISVDDFGTGYSSLSKLKKLPVRELKIDRSFIAQLPDDHSDVAIVGASVELAKRLGLNIVAEGVGNGTVARWLRDQGVEQAQGYYWSPPVAAKDFAAWAAEFNGGSTRQARILELA